MGYAAVRVAVSHARRAWLPTHAHTPHTHTLLEARMEAALAFVRVVASAPVAVCGASLSSRGRLMLPAVAVQA